MSTSDLIQPRHLTRRAVIYVRQSSPHQVLTNTESQRLQYAMTRRARELGWHEQDILIVDDDTGHTATTTAGRLAFQQLAAQVALGEIGVIVAYEATRLARNCTHWYQLLDLCGHAGCLIADRDGVYDPGSVNGRLLLGLKGAISELEMHTLRGRLIAGILSKAERGELALTLPTGLVRRDDGGVEKHPDQEVRSRIRLVFDTLLEKKSLARVVQHFHQHHLTVPRRDRHGAILWKRPTLASLGSMVKNPAYAGAFVYGRTRSFRAANTGKLRQRLLPPSQWRIVVRDHYPAYVSWETYERVQQMLRDNHAEYDRNKSRGVPRDGQALLHGIVYCGECGHKLCVQYKGGAQYLCNHLRQQHGEPVCQRLRAAPIDEQVVRWFFEALAPAAIDLSARTLTEADTQRTAILAARRQQLQRLRYAASRAALGGGTPRAAHSRRTLDAGRAACPRVGYSRRLARSVARHRTATARVVGPAASVLVGTEKITPEIVDRQGGAPSPRWSSRRPHSRARGVARRRDDNGRCGRFGRPFRGSHRRSRDGGNRPPPGPRRAHRHGNRGRSHRARASLGAGRHRPTEHGEDDPPSASPAELREPIASASCCRLFDDPTISRKT